MFKIPEAADGQAVQLYMCDIPDQGGYYKGPSFDGDVTSADVDKFLADYNSKALTRSQIEKATSHVCVYVSKEATIAGLVE
jgi:hypothetical protein